MFVSPPNYTVPALAVSQNCAQCTPEVVALIEDYNRRGHSSVFDRLACECRERWTAGLGVPASGDGLVAQVGRILDVLDARQAAVRAEGCP